MMKIMLTFLCLLLPSFVLSSEYNLTIDEDFEIEKQLKLLNKPAIKTIVENGDIFDCVDINNQPAFAHPSLKDHQIQLRPSSLPVGLFDNEEIKSSSRINSIEVRLQESCPSGTVPIKRVKKEQLIGMRSSFKKYKIRSSSSSNLNDDAASTQRWARIHTAFKPYHQFWYYGASGLVGIYGFPEMQATQFSSSGFWIANDDDQDQINYIVVGWDVDPKLNGDKNTRLMAGWTSDGFKSTGCMNYACPGFVQVSKDMPLGIAFNIVSTYNGSQHGIELYVYRDPATSNWLFLYGPNKKLVGYWPNNLFTTLTQYSTRLEFGGTAGYTGKAAFPPMGSGHFPDEGFGKSCPVEMVKYFDGGLNSNDLPLVEVTPGSTSPCYKVGDFTGSNNVGNYFYFGGPGGIDC